MYNITKLLDLIKEDLNFKDDDVDIFDLIENKANEYNYKIDDLDNLGDLFDDLDLDFLVDTYNVDLVAWLAVGDNYEYIDIAKNEYGEAEDFVQAMTYAQYYYYSEIKHDVINKIIEYIDNLEDKEKAKLLFKIKGV